MADQRAIELVCAKNIHNCFWLLENERHEKLRVTYAVSSNFKDTRLPVALFCGSMFGGRYPTLYLDHLASTKGLRIIFPDRPGMGGSTPVPLKMRVQVWLEIVPALLKHLDVHHIRLISHSAGTIYALNTIYQLREIIDPHAPYVALIAPWVHNEHSQVALLNWASKVPNGMMDSWNGITKFIGTRVNPSLSWSGGVVSSTMKAFRNSPAETDPAASDLAKLVGTSDEVATELQKLQIQFYFAEDTTAGNEDARLCLKKFGEGFWGACEDYEQYIGTLMAKERERLNTAPDQPKLRIRVFYAESDVMIGKGGQAYFERCWSHAGVKECIDYDSMERPGTNHDTVFIGGGKSAIETIFQDIGNYT